MRKQTIGLAGALMLCGISMLTGCGAAVWNRHIHFKNGKRR